MTAKQLQRLNARTKAAADRYEAAKAERDRAIVEAIAEGWTQVEVAKALGMTKMRISQIAGKAA